MGEGGPQKTKKKQSAWQEFMANGAFNNTTMSGEEFTAWLGETADKHKELMTGAGFIATN